MFRALILATTLGMLGNLDLLADPPTDPVTLASGHFRYEISATGENRAFIDLATGTDYLRPDPASSCAFVVQAGETHPVSEVTLEDSTLRLHFAKAGCTAVVEVDARPEFVRLRVRELEGDAVERLTFLNVPLTLQGRPVEPFGACAYSLNLHTRVDRLPALQSHLQASAETKFGITDAAAAIVAVPTASMLTTLQALLLDARDMPLCKVAGPWAHEIPFNHGSYLFNFGSLTESNVTDWIDMARSLGVTQIDHHGGSAFFRFGDFELNRDKWTDGWKTYQRILDQLDEAGIDSIFHTYAFFIDKASRYVTPVPDPRLDAFRTFTLAEPLTADATTIQVNESTADISTTTGFFEHNSVILHLGDELVTFGGLTREPPYTFTQVTRGALGTTAAAHDVNTPARHLKECFGLLVPDPESSLFTEIAANHADIVNRAGFKGIYLDAIDGSSILRGTDECWYWADKFVFEIQRRLKKPVGMEMSAMWHHFWQYRTRWQAWDYPERGHQRFVDIHAATVNGGLLLPLHLGWWNFQSFNPPQIDPSYPEVIEYLGAKMVGYNAGISLTGSINQERLRSTPLFQRGVDILRTAETLRHEGSLDETTLARLREPGQAFTLSTNAAGAVSFVGLHAPPHRVSSHTPTSLTWITTNPYPAQPLRFRLEALMSAAVPNYTNSINLGHPSQAHENWQITTAPGVTASITNNTLIATNSGTRDRSASWARFTRRFTPPVNLSKYQGLALNVHGDGLGELLALRLESPRHLSFGAIADRYLTINFTGSRQATLVESESSSYSDYTWDDSKQLYNVYRETIRFDTVDTLSLFLQNLPTNKPVRLDLGNIRAVPLESITITNPVVTINGQPLTLPCTLTSGSWIEAFGPDACTLFDPQGQPILSLYPTNPWPSAVSGTNIITLLLPKTPTNSPPLRARLTPLLRDER